MDTCFKKRIFAKSPNVERPGRFSSLLTPDSVYNPVETLWVSQSLSGPLIVINICNPNTNEQETSNKHIIVTNKGNML